MSKSRGGGQGKSGSGVPKYQPVGAVKPAEKVPRTLDHDNDDINDRCPVWRFGFHDTEWPPAYPGLDAKGFQEVLAKLAQFETQKIGFLWGPQTHNKVYDTSEIPSHARKRLEAIERDDETNLWTLRLQGKFRVMGILREHIFHVLWVDPEHEVYPSPKKNT